MIDFQSSHIYACVLDCGSPLPLLNAPVHARAKPCGSSTVCRTGTPRSNINPKLTIHHSKLSKTPAIKVQLSLIKVNKAYLSIFRPPSPLPPFYLTKNRQIIDLYGFTILNHVKKVRVLYEKKRVQIRDKKQKLESIFSVLVRCSSAIFSYVLVQIQY
ncbi:MAG TPA: hypothetical protein VNU95_07355 [Candidatus Acidoferrales bacterium]|jgi:hypothetical protein|nr:hypothetical protein [Candidatus Acidoferrales bacterium]